VQYSISVVCESICESICAARQQASGFAVSVVAQVSIYLGSKAR
jgi:hypothetical protein